MCSSRVQGEMTANPRQLRRAKSISLPGQGQSRGRKPSIFGAAGARCAAKPVSAVRLSLLLAGLWCTAALGQTDADVVDNDDTAISVQQVDPATEAAIASDLLAARMELLQGDRAAVRERLDALADDYPDAVAPLASLLLLDLAEGRLNLAKRRLKAYEGDDIVVRTLGAGVDLADSRAGAALRTLRPLVDSHPQDAGLLALRGSAQLQLGDLEAALETVRRLREASDYPQRPFSDGWAGILEGLGADRDILAFARDAAPDLLPLRALIGLSQLAGGNYDEALETARALVADRPQSALAYNLLGATQLARGENGEAREAFERSLSLAPHLVGVDINLARLDQKAGDYNTAERRYRRVLARVPDHLDALMGMVDIADARDQPFQAIDWLEKAWQRHPEIPEVGLTLVKRYLEDNRSGAALVTARQLHDVFGERPAVIRAYGLGLLAAGDNAEAEVQFRRLVAVEPEADNWHLLASALIRRQDYIGAREALASALAVDPDFLPARIVNVQLDMLDHDFAAALSTAEEIQARFPNLSVGYQLEGEVRVASGEFSQAVRSFQTAFRQEPSARIALLLANAQRLAGRPDGAVVALRAWLTRRPDDAAVRTQLALELDRMGRHDDAIVQYHKLIEQNPDDVMVLNNLAWLYLERGDTVALDFAERALAGAPERPEVMDTLGWAELQLGDAERGVAMLEAALERAPHLADIRFHLAVAYEKQGRVDDARVELERLMADQVADDNTFSYREQAEAMWQRLHPRDDEAAAPPSS